MHVNYSNFERVQVISSFSLCVSLAPSPEKIKAHTAIIFQFYISWLPIKWWCWWKPQKSVKLKIISQKRNKTSTLLTIILNFDYLGPDIAVVSDQIIKVDTTALHNEVRKMRIDEVPPPPAFDDLRNYAFEGSGSTAGSLSSVLDSSGTRLK